MAKVPPTIVFFAGAFAEPTCFDTIAAFFRDEGYSTVYARFPSLEASSPEDVTTSKDSESARNEVLLPLIEGGKDVIVFVHSYGGVVGGQAAFGLSKISRSAEGKSGGVIGLLYLAGNIVHEGGTLLDAIGGIYPPFIKDNFPRKGLAVIEPVMETLYNDADMSIKADMEAGMKPHALAAFETPATAPAWSEPVFDGRRAYLKTMDDHCNPVEFAQQPWLLGCGVDWIEVELAGSSHCPFITRPKEVVDCCVPIFKKWIE